MLARPPSFVPLLLVVIPLSGVATKNLLAPPGRSVGAELRELRAGPEPRKRRRSAPGLTVDYFRGRGHYSVARFALRFPSQEREQREARPSPARLFARIERLETDGFVAFARAASEIIIERDDWKSARDIPSLHQSGVLLLPGRYRLRLFIEDADARSVATIDRILLVPSFPKDELGISSMVAVFDPDRSRADVAESRTLYRKVDRRVRRGQPLVAFVEAYVPPGPPGGTVSVQFVLRRGDRVVYEETHHLRDVQDKVTILESFDTAVLERGPYHLQAAVSLSSSEERASSRLELTIEDASP